MSSADVTRSREERLLVSRRVVDDPERLRYEMSVDGELAVDAHPWARSSSSG